MPSMIRGRRADSAREDWADMPATLSGYPGPVLQITASGELQPMNDDGRWLIDALDRPAAREAASRLLDLIKRAIDDKNTTRDILALPADRARARDRHGRAAARRAPGAGDRTGYDRIPSHDPRR